MLRHLVAILTLVVIVSTNAVAAVYSEPPDFGDFGSPVDIGTLPIGTSNISGSLSTSCVTGSMGFADCSSGDENDLIMFSLPGGHELSDLVLEISGFSVSGTLDTQGLGSGLLGLFNFSFDGTYFPAVSDAVFFSEFLFQVVSSSQFDPVEIQGTGDISFNYSLSFDVVSSAVIPIPASGALMASALLGVGLLRRRKKAS